eukprot:TRINITY_DN6016_c0_g1_i1.p2 TRINITY_DN6016_c0_g1~~TRINITY_DN6016_c0_g1_i1.p2  ORF type:complete len:448 (+),score=159.06 TRINITY_DN6016_c0_g1_i1:74-1417(+)
MDSAKQAEYVEVLRDEQSKHHIEFFRKSGDEERRRGLVNHIPLTLIAAAYLGEPLASLKPFLEQKYEAFLDNFGTTLVPPITPDVTPPPPKDADTDVSALLSSLKPFVHEGGGMPTVKALLLQWCDALGSVRAVVNAVLPFALEHGSAAANVFHSVLLVAFPFELRGMSGGAAGAQWERDVVAPLVCAGLSMMITKSGSNALRFGNLCAEPAGAQPLVLTATSIGGAVEAVREDAEWHELWAHMLAAAESKPMFLFNFFPYWSAAEQHPGRLWQRLFSRHLDPHALAEHAPKDVLFALSCFILSYYAHAQGFVAVHLVSSIRAMLLLSALVDDASFFAQLLRVVWRQVSFLVLSLEHAAQLEGVSGGTRARGERSADEVTPEELNPPELPCWAEIRERAVLTNTSHSIKLVYAVAAIADAHASHPEHDTIDQLARRAACVAIAFRIP